MTFQQSTTLDRFEELARETGARLVVEDHASAAGPQVLISEHFTGYGGDCFLWAVAPDGGAELIG